MVTSSSPSIPAVFQKCTPAKTLPGSIRSSCKMLGNWILDKLLSQPPSPTHGSLNYTSGPSSWVSQPIRLTSPTASVTVHDLLCLFVNQAHTTPSPWTIAQPPRPRGLYKQTHPRTATRKLKLILSRPLSRLLNRHLPSKHHKPYQWQVSS